MTKCFLNGRLTCLVMVHILIYNPVPMGDDNKELFKRVLQGFLDRHKFDLPELLIKKVKITKPATTP